MKKTVLTLFLMITIAALLAGCGTKSRETQGGAVLSPGAEEEIRATATPKESLTATPQETPEENRAPITIEKDLAIEKGAWISVVGKSVDSAHWKNLEKYMRQCIEDINREYQLEGEDKITMTFEGPAQEDDVTGQINIIDAVLAENPSVICLAAIDAQSCQAQLETAKENGIPVIMFDSGVSNDETVQFYCGTDNTKAAREAADKLSQAMGGSGKVIVAAHENYTQTSKERVKGFRRRMAKKHAGVTVGRVLYENKTKSMEESLRALLDKDEDIRGIFCTSGPLAQQALEVMKDYPDRELKLVGFDGGSQQKKAIEDGIEYGTVVQDIYRMAYETIWAALKNTIPNGEMPREKQLLIPHTWVDISNISAEGNKNNLYD